MSYLDRYKGYKKKDSRSKQSIKFDRWDQHTANQIRREVRDYLIAEQELGEKVDTGIEAMNDALFSLYKAKPEMEDSKDIRPSHRVNHAVIEELQKLANFEKNRHVSIGDPIGTGLACAAMEPELEILFEKLSEAQKMASSLDEMVSDYEEMQQDADDLMEQMQNSDQEEAKDFQEDIDKINEAMEELAKQIASTENELENELADKQPAMNQHLKNAMDKVSDDADAMQQVESWGLQPGGVRRMSPEARLSLSKKLQSEKFKRMADIFGKMQSIAMHEQTHKVDYASEEIYELEQGADIHRVVPVDMLALTDDILVYDWLRRFVERSLIQYSLRGEENVAKGGIIILEDGSSSMAGTREIWAKGIGLALLKIATIQKRPFSAVNFAGPGMYVRWDFDTTGSVIKSVKSHRGHEQYFEGIEAVLDYAETAMNGGTNFETPFSIGLDILQKQYDQNGSVEGDIVFLTDGECGMSQEFINSFKAEQSRLGFEVFGVAIQTNPKSEPMYTMCDTKVIGLKQLTDINDIRPLFSGL
jgi:uncharacterized protein with von Willebrand factor type A (vWA) domain